MTAVQDLLLSTFVIVVIVNILLGQEKRNRTEKGRDGKVYLLLFAAPPQSRRRIGDNGYDFVHVDGSKQQSAAIPHEYRVGHANESHAGQSHIYITMSSFDLFPHVITHSKNHHHHLLIADFFITLSRVSINKVPNCHVHLFIQWKRGDHFELFFKGISRSSCTNQ